MKYILTILAIQFSFSFLVQADSSACMWTDSSYANFGFYSNAKRASKGWIFCEKGNLSSVELTRYKITQKQFIDRYVKTSHKDEKIKKVTPIGSISVKFGKVTAKRTIIQVVIENDVFDSVFFFFSIDKRKYVFSADLLARPYGKDLKTATKEIEKILKERPELFKN